MMIARQNFATYLRLLQGIHLAISFMTLLIGGAFFFMGDKIGMTNMPDAWLYGALAIVTLQGSAAYFIGKNKIEQARLQPALSQKLYAYRQALLVRFALLETAVVVSLIVYSWSRQPAMLGLAAIVLATLVWLRPSRDRLVGDLELSTKEQADLDNPDVIVFEVNT